MSVVTRFYKYIKIEGKKLYYTEFGQGFPTIVFLGWMSNIDYFPFEEAFAESDTMLQTNRFIFIHLSNFSRSTYSKHPYTLDDYAIEIEEIMDKLEIEKANFIGHSAGGRIVLYFTIKCPVRVKKLVLVSAAGLKHANASHKMLANAPAYFAKHHITDPKEKAHLRQTFKNLYNTDLLDLLPSIKHKTLIIWGQRDETINVGRAYTFKQHIPNSMLVIYPNLGHNIFVVPKVVNKILDFITHDI